MINFKTKTQEAGGVGGLGGLGIRGCWYECKTGLGPSAKMLKIREPKL